MARTITNTTTQTAIGFTFMVHARGGDVARKGGELVPAPGAPVGVEIRVQHLDSAGKPVPFPRATPQVVKGQHRPGMLTPSRPVDRSLAVVMAKQYSGTPAQILAQMAADYEALEYPPPPAPAAK